MQIPPKYFLSPEIIDLIAKIEANRIFLNNTEIAKDIKIKIERVSLLKSSLFSARIEGNPLTLNNFADSPDRLKKKEITNILKAIKYIDLELKSGQLTESVLIKIHQTVMQDLTPDAGRFRREISAIFNKAGVAVYTPPPPSMLEILIKKLLFYINSTKEQYHLITAFLSHLVFEKIHPFLDGNGRVGRLLIFSVLKNKGWNFPLFLSIEEYLDSHKDEYYYYLDTGMTETESYLKFMLGGLYETSENIKEQLLSQINRKQEILLPPRQEEILNIIRDHNIVSLDFIKRRFLKVPARTLRYDLKKLVNKKLILKIGKTRGSFYKMK